MNTSAELKHLSDSTEEFASMDYFTCDDAYISCIILRLQQHPWLLES